MGQAGQGEKTVVLMDINEMIVRIKNAADLFFYGHSGACGYRDAFHLGVSQLNAVAQALEALQGTSDYEQPNISRQIADVTTNDHVRMTHLGNLDGSNARNLAEARLKEAAKAERKMKQTRKAG